MFPAVHQSVADAIQSHSLEAILNSVRETVVVVDANWRVTFCNDIYLNGLGLQQHEVLGKTPFDYVPGFAKSIFFETIEDCRTKRRPTSKIGFSKALNRWLLVRVFPIGDGLCMLTNDAGESIVRQYQLAQKVTRDTLTGLPNKLALEARLQQLIKHEEPFSVLALGILRLKDVNDAHGHAVGDMVLLEVVSSIQSETQTGELLYRTAGNELVLLIESATAHSAQRAAALIELVKRPLHAEGLTIVQDACAGTLSYPADGADVETVTKRLSLAMSAAKRAGRDTVCAYRQELELSSHLRAQLEADLRLALGGGQFVLLLQPKLSLATDAVIGAEALIRWAHPKRGLLGPAAFLSIAQDIGAMQAIDQWVIRKACRLALELQKDGLELPISVNVSVDSLSDSFFAERFQGILADEGVAAPLIEFEIPEGALMHDVQASTAVLNSLHATGAVISIDDFGTGYSSFAYLAQFPINCLKIDRSFVQGLTASGPSSKIIRGIVRLAHSLSMAVVAEGVETEAQLNLLKRMKCDVVQGFFYSRPVALPEFKAFVASRPARPRADPYA